MDTNFLRTQHQAVLLTVDGANPGLHWPQVRVATLALLPTEVSGMMAPISMMAISIGEICLGVARAREATHAVFYERGCSSRAGDSLAQVGMTNAIVANGVMKPIESTSPNGSRKQLR